MKTILLDTSFLVDCLAWKIDFFSELKRICDFSYRLAVVDRSIDEIVRLAGQGSQQARLGARLARQLIAKKRIGIIRTPAIGHADVRILAVAGKNTFVATQDKELKRRLKSKGVPVIVIRQRKYLQLVG